MKNDFLIAITQLSAEKNLPKEVVFEAVEVALASAYKKDNQNTNTVVVRIDPTSGMVRAYNQKTVVEEVTDAKTEIELSNARRYRSTADVGEIVDIEMVVQTSGRIAAQTAKQVVLQKLREAEREVVFEEYADKEGDILSGVVQRVEPKQVIIDLGKTEALLPISEQVRTEHYHGGQRLKVFLVEVNKAPRGPQVIVSRSHKNLIRRLFELEVPEIFRGVVELKSIAREPGYRSKVAVGSRQEGVDPVGACVGLRGIRIQNIVNELNGERIDVVQWDPDPARFVANALSPAQVVTVSVSEEDNTASVVVPDRQLSLAIGKEGQNARLAAKLTGWRIDIKSQAAAEQERLLEPEQPTAAAIVAEPEPGEVEELRRQPAVIEPAVVQAIAAEPVLAPIEEISQPEPIAAAAPAPVPPAPRPPLAARVPRLRFAEDLAVPPLEAIVPSKPETRGKNVKSKKTEGREEEETEAAIAARAKRGKKVYHPAEEEEEEDEYAYLTKHR
ncbi:MAG: transcription termination factor NusA [Dehalococcoidia bacterium]